MCLQLFPNPRISLKDPQLLALLLNEALYSTWTQVKSHHDLSESRHDLKLIHQYNIELDPTSLHEIMQTKTSK